MKRTTFVPDCKLLLKIEKCSRGCEKFSGMDAMLFATASGWIWRTRVSCNEAASLEIGVIIILGVAGTGSAAHVLNWLR